MDACELVVLCISCYLSTCCYSHFNDMKGEGQPEHLDSFLTLKMMLFPQQTLSKYP